MPIWWNNYLSDISLHRVYLSIIVTLMKIRLHFLDKKVIIKSSLSFSQHYHYVQELVCCLVLGRKCKVGLSHLFHLKKERNQNIKVTAHKNQHNEPKEAKMLRRAGRNWFSAGSSLHATPFHITQSQVLQLLIRAA